MAELPSINDVLLPVLQQLSEGCRNSRECIPGVAADFGFGEEATVPAPGTGSKPRLMITHGVGVRRVETITLHQIDGNFFAEE